MQLEVRLFGTVQYRWTHGRPDGGQGMHVVLNLQLSGLRRIKGEGARG